MLRKEYYILVFFRIKRVHPPTGGETCFAMRIRQLAEKQGQDNHHAGVQ